MLISLSLKPAAIRTMHTFKIVAAVSQPAYMVNPSLSERALMTVTLDYEAMFITTTAV